MSLAIKSIQRGLHSGTSSGTYNVTISAVTLAKSFVKSKGYSNTGSEYTIRLTSTTNLQIVYLSGDGKVSWEVVEYV